MNKDEKFFIEFQTRIYDVHYELMQKYCTKIETKLRN